MAYEQTIALARQALGHGRVADVVRMIEPLIDDAQLDAPDGEADALLRALLGRVQTVAYGRPRETVRLLEHYVGRQARQHLSAHAAAEVALSLAWAFAWHDARTYDDAHALALLHDARAAFQEHHNGAGQCSVELASALVFATIDEYALMEDCLKQARELIEPEAGVLDRQWLVTLEMVLARSSGDLRGLKAGLEAYGLTLSTPSDSLAAGRLAAFRAACHADTGATPDVVGDAAREAAAKLTGLGTHASYPLLLAYRCRLNALVRAGRWDEVEAASAEAATHIGDLPAAHAYLALPSILTDVYRGRFDAAAERLEQVRRQTPPVRHRLLTAHTQLTAARLHLASGDANAALAAAADATRLGEETAHRRLQLEALVLQAKAAVRAGQSVQARDLLLRASASPLPYRLPALAAHCLEVRAALALQDDAPELACAAWMQAICNYDASGDVYHAARVRLELAEAQQSRNAPWARQLAAAARGVFHDLKAEPLERRAAELLRVLPHALSAEGWTVAESVGERLTLGSQPVSMIADLLLDLARAALPDHWAALYVHRLGEWSVIRDRGTPPDDASPTMHPAESASLRALHLGAREQCSYWLAVETRGGSAWSRLERWLEPWGGTAALALDHAERQASRTEATGVPAPDHSSHAKDSVIEHTSVLQRSRINVMIYGERGTERREHAVSLHRGGDAPFVEVDCRDASHEVLEHALFGHAPSRTPGAIHSAAGGTLVLHHVEAMPQDVQHRLLRVLEKGEVTPPEADEPCSLRLRVVATTTAMMADAVANGSFDAALLARLAPARLRLSPLRTRPSEIPRRAQRYLNAHRSDDEPPVTLTTRALDALVTYEWPGNDRQLRNEMQRALERVRAEPLPVVDLQDLSEMLRSLARVRDAGEAPSEAVLSGDKSLDDVLADLERDVIIQALDAHDGQVSSTADALGLTRQGLYKKMKRLGVNGYGSAVSAASAPMVSEVRS